MRGNEKLAARKQLDKRLNKLRGSDAVLRPPHGWIRAIRTSLGITLEQLAKKMEISRPRVAAIETAEKNQAITMETLHRAARALNCHMVYAFVPNEPLETMVEKQALQLAKKILNSADHTMKLENQEVDFDNKKIHLEALQKQLIANSDSSLWRTE